jgi:hypothetical protein
MRLFWLTLFLMAPFSAYADPLTMATTAVSALSTSGSTLSILGTIASVGGSLISGLGQMKAGKAAQQSANFQAQQLEQAAGQDRAAAQRVAINERRRTNIAQSNATAAAAASGGGATDPTVLNITGGLASQGEYNALSALFEGEESARGKQLQATTARAEGKMAAKAGRTSGITTIASGFGSALFNKYAPASTTGYDSRTYSGYEYSKSGLPWQAAGNKKPAWMA